jgi:hypothetical protein
MKQLLISLAIGISALGLLTACQEDKTHGLTAHYYNNEFWILKPLKTKQVKNVDYIWFGDEEKPLTAPFGIIFEGKVSVPQSGDITFFLASDDGSILEIDGEPLIDNNTFHSNTEKSAKLKLEKGLHDIVVKYNELQGGSELHLSWSLPGGEKEIIDTRFFQPTDPLKSKFANKSYPDLEASDSETP